MIDNELDKKIRLFQAKKMQKDSVGNNQAPTAAPSLDASGELNLEKEYPWQNKSGQVASGLFMELLEAELKISMNRGSREVLIPLDSLNENSVTLAKNLQALLEKENKRHCRKDHFLQSK